MGERAYQAARARARAAIAAEARRCMEDATAGIHAIKERISYLALTLGWPYGRTEDIWRKEAVLEAWELEALRQLCLPRTRTRVREIHTR